MSRQFLGFVIAGGIAAVANFGSRSVLSLWLPYVVAITIAYGIGMAVAFVLNRLFVFRDADNALAQQGLWFVLVNLAAVAQTILISLLFARWLFPAMNMQFHPETIAHGIGVIVPVFTSFIGHRTLTFRKARSM